MAVQGRSARDIAKMTTGAPGSSVTVELRGGGGQVCWPREMNMLRQLYCRESARARERARERTVREREVEREREGEGEGEGHRQDDHRPARLVGHCRAARWGGAGPPARPVMYSSIFQIDRQMDREQTDRG